MESKTAGGRPALFCFGLGYSAEILGQALMAQGWSVAGTCRSPETRDRLREKGFEVHLFERGRKLAEARDILNAATHLLSSIPPDSEGDPVIDLRGGDLESLTRLRWVGYLSTTGVYGDRGGAWVDETSALQPTGERGKRRVAAEAAWLDLHRRHGLPVHIFRLAGIYGPGRNALETVRAGRAQRIEKKGQVFSRIHVADIAAVLRASFDRPRPGAIYNLCDDDPAPPQDVVEFACRLLGVAPPPLVPFEHAQLSDMARSFYADNKLVSNRLIKEELGVRLTYPSYKDGLTALLAK